MKALMSLFGQSIVGLVALLLLVPLLAGCGQAADAQAPAAATATMAGEEASVGDLIVGREANGHQVELSPGQALIVRLEANPSTGYGWEVAEIDPALLQQVGEIEFQEGSAGSQGLVGAAGVQVMHFVARDAGQAPLKLVYRRPWEKDVEPLETFVLQVNVVAQP